MANYGRRLQFGFCPSPLVADAMRPLRLATLAETLELDYAGVQAAPANPAHHEPWTLLAAMGMVTSRISLFVHLADWPLRSPALLAKAAASLDLLTNGRLDLGLSTAAAGDAEAQTRLAEAVQTMHFMWGNDRAASPQDQLAQWADLPPGPRPAHRIGVWLAADAPTGLALAGRLADGWIAADGPASRLGDLAGWSKHLDDAAAAAGREPSEIRRICAITGTIDNRGSDIRFQGSVHQWAASLAELATEVGIDTFLLMEGEDAEDQIRKFALEVVPHTRELLDLAPGVEASSGLSRAYEGFCASGATPAEEETDEVDWVDETSMGSFPASDPPASASVA